LGGAVFWFEIPFRPDDTHTSSSNVGGRKSNTAVERLVEVATSAAASLSPILIVDDDMVIRTTLSNTLKTLGFTTETASNGAKGLAKMVQKEYAMVLSDVQMPRMDGYSMLESMREWETGQGDGGGSGVQRCQRNGRRQPLIFMSANFTAANRVEISRMEQMGRDAQQCGWLAKPVAAFDVLTAIMRHARTPPTTVEGGEREMKSALTRTAATTASSSVPVVSSLSAAATEGTSNDEKDEGERGGASISCPPDGLQCTLLPTLDVKQCQQALQEMYGDVCVPLLREDIPNMLPELTSDLETLLAAPTAKQAHKMKGSYRTVRTTGGG
jgi:CheY-like chemotaxis protein